MFQKVGTKNAIERVVRERQVCSVANSLATFGLRPSFAVEIDPQSDGTTTPKFLGVIAWAAT